MEFFKDKRIFITGITGFKGSWLALLLKKMGAKTYGIDMNLSNDTLFYVLGLNEDVIVEKIDVCNYKKLESLLKKLEPDIIFHLAAQAIVRVGYEEPVLTFNTNIMGTVNILEIARKLTNLKAVVNITTDKCYENKEQIYPYREIDPLGANDPYSSSKACSEIVTWSYYKAFFKERKIGIATVRSGNVIGGGDFSVDRLIPDIVKTIFMGEKLVIRSPEAIRPWQYVLDPLYGYILLAKKLCEEPEKFSQPFNFSPDIKDMIKVKEILNIAREIFEELNYELLEKREYKESTLLLLDSTKARLLLGWHHKYPVKEALEETFNWYRNYFYNRNNIVKYSEEIIEKYLEK